MNLVEENIMKRLTVRGCGCGLWRSVCVRSAAAALANLAAASAAHAGGHLWLGAEFAGEGNVYRYDIANNLVELMGSPTLPAGAAHFNNMATDGVFVYYGNPTTNYLGIADIYTGVVATSTTYSSSLTGHKEDGAYHCGSASLWRATFSGNRLHETTLSGTVLTSYVGVSNSLNGIVGLEWVGDQLYATNYTTGTFGEITLDGTNATYTVIPFNGLDPSGNAGALAYDEEDDVLYGIFNNNDLYRLDIARGMVTLTLVVDLGAVGYPAGGLVDGMGWVSLPPEIGTCPADIVSNKTVQPPPDGIVDGADLAYLLAEWGPNPDSLANIAHISSVSPPKDCRVDGADLAFMLSEWGPCE